MSIYLTEPVYQAGGFTVKRVTSTDGVSFRIENSTGDAWSVNTLGEAKSLIESMLHPKHVAPKRAAPVKPAKIDKPKARRRSA